MPVVVKLRGGDMSRNFNLRSRDMSRAGKNALDLAARRGAASFSTAATNAERWAHFCIFARVKFKVRYMEAVTVEIVVAYGESLQDQVASGKMAASTAQNRLSAVNSVMRFATQGR
jgi:hypothetical protein